tara:strand:- start:483 stop:656 length:174 start_codon:yes stop_codon:yes gene_type:complete
MLPVIFTVRDDDALSTPVLMAYVPLALTVTPLATLTVMGVVSAAASYPAAVACVRIL